jgi:hypothetical protein
VVIGRLLPVRDWDDSLDRRRVERRGHVDEAVVGRLDDREVRVDTAPPLAEEPAEPMRTAAMSASRSRPARSAKGDTRRNTPTRATPASDEEVGVGAWAAARTRCRGGDPDAAGDDLRPHRAGIECQIARGRRTATG